VADTVWLQNNSSEWIRVMGNPAFSLPGFNQVLPMCSLRWVT
jgi:hypothetical protein